MINKYKSIYFYRRKSLFLGRRDLPFISSISIFKFYNLFWNESKYNLRILQKACSARLLLYSNLTIPCGRALLAQLSNLPGSIHLLDILLYSRLLVECTYLSIQPGHYK